MSGGARDIGDIIWGYDGNSKLYNSGVAGQFNGKHHAFIIERIITGGGLSGRYGTPVCGSLGQTRIFGDPSPGNGCQRCASRSSKPEPHR
jgi:hypothetical protein